MKLKEYAEKMGVTYMTAYRWAKSGKIPNCTIMPSGTIIIDEEKIPENEIKKDTNDILGNILLLRKEMDLKLEHINKKMEKLDRIQDLLSKLSDELKNNNEIL